ncbi:MAG: hypothetical protein JO036_13400 [Candidatus Eremiobacteraeota bacterium]|nr:hypothetical protein [Candidatus Eremiobacteraeota bacterium]
MTASLLRFEATIARAAARRAVRHPTRRTLWSTVGALAVIAFAVEVVTSPNAARTLGAWSPTPVLVLAVCVVVLALAALAGRHTSLTYGTRAADTVWWRYAGVTTQEGQRATTAVLAVRATATVAAVAAPLGVLFASVDPARAGSIILMAVAAIGVAPLSVVTSSLTAFRTSDDSRARARDVVPNERWRARVPRGLAAARWLIARRRGEALVPLVHFLGGALLGAVLPFAAARAGGQTTALAVVVGGFALLVDGALRRTTAPATLLTPWWRAALGTSARAIAVWAFADAVQVAAFAAAAAPALGIAIGKPLLGVAAVPLVVLTPVASRLISLSVDVFFSRDRRGPGAFVRVVLTSALAVLVVLASLSAGARAGAPAALATATALVAAYAVAAAAFCEWRLSAAV